MKFMDRVRRTREQFSVGDSEGESAEATTRNLPERSKQRRPPDVEFLDIDLLEWRPEASPPSSSTTPPGASWSSSSPQGSPAATATPCPPAATSDTRLPAAAAASTPRPPAGTSRRFQQPTKKRKGANNELAREEARALSAELYQNLSSNEPWADFVAAAATAYLKTVRPEKRQKMAELYVNSIRRITADPDNADCLINIVP